MSDLLATGPPLEQGRHKTGLAIPVVLGVLFVAIGWFGPNFRTTPNEVRDNPLGGDFLQEYAGGKLWLDPATRGQLYSLDAFRAAQHDSDALGFSWPKEKYFPAVYPPFWYAAISPLSQLEYLTAARVWLAMMVVALIASLVLLKRCANVPVPMMLVLCLSAPVLISLGSGQKGSLLLLILTMSYCLFRNNRPIASGVMFSLIAFKPHLALPIGLLMLACEQWRWVAGALAGLLVLVVASLVSGPANCIEYVQVCLGFGDYIQSGGYHLEQGYSLWSGWQMLIADSRIAKGMTLVSSIVILAAAIGVLRSRLPGNQNERAIVIAAMTMVTIILSPHLYVYDLTLLILPAGLLARNAMDQPARWENWLPVGLIVTVMFGTRPLEHMAFATGFHPGAFFLLAALVLILSMWQNPVTLAKETANGNYINDRHASNGLTHSGA